MKQLSRFEWQGGGRDEWYTPAEAVKPILKHLKPGAKVLCPFDTPESNFVKILTKNGFKVIHSHISEGKDFFKLEKPDVDYIISNPPFSKREEVLMKLYEWQIPFAMILNESGLFDSRQRSGVVKKYGAEIMYLYPRVKYIGEQGKNGSAPFQSVYWCYKILPEKLMLEIIQEDTGQMRLEGL